MPVDRRVVFASNQCQINSKSKGSPTVHGGRDSGAAAASCQDFDSRLRLRELLTSRLAALRSGDLIEVQEFLDEVVVQHAHIAWLA